MPNFDPPTVAGFGDEWERFTQTQLDPSEKEQIFLRYFRIFPWSLLPAGGGIGADIGCGSGRWATLVAPHVALLHCIDASPKAVDVAIRNLSSLTNVQVRCASVDDMPFPDESLDFAYSLGVLHHVPDTAAAVRSIFMKLRPGAPFLVYLYYALDGRPGWYRWMWKMSELGRFCISRSPRFLRYAVSQIIATTLYWPLARIAKVLEKVGRLPAAWPLAFYRHRSFYVMRNDALDRFGTRLEKRFSRSEIDAMLRSAGFEDIRFSDAPPYWCAIGIKGGLKGTE